MQPAHSTPPKPRPCILLKARRSYGAIIIRGLTLKYVTVGIFTAAGAPS
jgi:hypothetical protein